MNEGLWVLVLLFVWGSIVWDRILQHSPDYAVTHYGAQARLKLEFTFLLEPPESVLIELYHK